MKVLINTPKLNCMGGIANYYFNLKELFVNDVKYNFIGGKGNSRFKIFFLLFNYLKFIYLIIIYNPRIVHLNPSLDETSNLRDAIYLLIAKLFNKKVLVFWRGWKLSVEKRINGNYKVLFIYIYNKADAFCVLSSYFKEKLSSWGIEKPIFLETTLVSDQLFDRINIMNKTYDKIRLLFLSRIRKEKGIFEVIEVFRILSKKYNNVELLIAGDGPEFNTIKKSVEQFDDAKIRLLGYIRGEKKIEILTKCNIFILPSYTEGMPNCILEAMAFGNCIITRPVGGIKDFFMNEKMGYITDSINPVVFASLIEKLILNPQLMRQISQFNYYYAKSNFMASKVAARIENIYQTIT